MRRLGGPSQCAFGQLRRVGVTRDLAVNAPQSKPFGCVITCRLEPAIVENKRFGTRPLKEQLAIVPSGNGIAQNGEGGLAVQLGFKRGKATTMTTAVPFPAALVMNFSPNNP